MASHHVWVAPADLGTRIRRARERKRWSQEQLAREIGVGVRTVGRWERGEAEPKSAIGALEEVLGASFDSSENGAPFVPADDDEARIWAMDEPEQWRRQMIAWKRQGEGRARAAS